MEGELPEDGLAAYGDDGDDLMLALARKLVNGNEDDPADTVEVALTQARAAETESEKYLVDDSWQTAEPEVPTTAEIHLDTDAADLDVAEANSDDCDSNVVRPEAECVPETSFIAANRNGEVEATESQRTLFSWAEFMANPGGHARSAQPSLSLFEWAVTIEQAQEEEKVVVPA